MEDRQSTTPVATKSVSTQPAKCPIDQIRVGMRVLAHNPEVSIEERSGFVQPSSEIWRFLKLEMTKPDGGILKIEMIRPSEWLEASGAKVGSEIQLDLKELGADGAALVQEILPCPEIQSGEGQVVTATFQHPPSHQVLDVIFQGNEQPMGVTSNHLFWSADKKKFVPIGEMEIGERVQTWQGETKRIVSKLARAIPERVFNIEVWGEHVYFISSQKLLAHNECFSRSIIRETALETLEEITNNARANGRVITSTEQHHAVFRSILKAFDMLANASEDGSSAFLPGPNAIGGSKFSDFIDQQDLIPIEANLHQEFLHRLYNQLVFGRENGRLSTKDLAAEIVEQGLTPRDVFNRLVEFYDSIRDELPAGVADRLIEEVSLIQFLTDSF